MYFVVCKNPIKYNQLYPDYQKNFFCDNQIIKHITKFTGR